MKYQGQTVNWRELEKGDKGFAKKNQKPTQEELDAEDYVIVIQGDGIEKRVLRSELSNE